MRLESFRVFNFRSINDSGDIDVSKLTALLGRNESGKSNLLLALGGLNPPEGFSDLNPVKDFPRDRPLKECADDTDVVSTLWSLNEDERTELVGILPRAKGIKQVKVGRYYKNRWVGFVGLGDHPFDEKDIKAKIRKVGPAVKALAKKADDGLGDKLSQAADEFEKKIAIVPNRTTWAQNAGSAISDLRQALAEADMELTEAQEENLGLLEDLAESLASDREAQKNARAWVVEKLPIFIVLDEYPELKGHQNISEYLSRKNDKNKELTQADVNFEKLCKVSGLEPNELHELLTQKDQETRNQLANRASAIMTSEIKRLWKDRALKIRFNLDAEHFDTLISDPSAVYDVEVNLDERSRGFKWFLSFYVTFAADTKGGDAENAILLLDEPGLYLHAKSQSDLLAHLDEDFRNQIIYTTHSPFMVPTHKLDSVRTVKIAENEGTTVTNDPTGDSRTLFPIQAALGYDLAQSLFVGPNNLVVEGVTDYWVLSSVSEYLRDQGRIGLSDKLTLTPAGGAQKVSYMVALLTSEDLNVLVLLDDEKDAKNTKDDLVKSKLIRDRNVVFVTEGFNGDVPKEADIEDLLDRKVYEELVRESYSTELDGKELNLNENIPRIAKRIEAAFGEIGVEFFKTRPARLFLNKMAAEPERVVNEETAERFERIFSVINERLEKHVARDGEPFE